MKYYKLTTIGVNRKEIGASPQSEECYFGDIQKESIPGDGRIDFDFELPVPKLVEKAKLTDVLNVMAIPHTFLVTKNCFASFLNDFNIGNFQQWPIKVEYKKKELDDYSLFFICDSKQSERIDYPKSDFYIGKLTDYAYVGETIKVSDYDNYNSMREVLRKDGLWLKHRKVVLDLHNSKEDLFKIVNAPASGHYISESLKFEIEKNGFTGMAIKEITLDKKIEVIY